MRLGHVGSILALVLTGCVSSPERGPDPADDGATDAGPAAEEDERARKIADAEHELDVARARLEIARLEQEAQQREQEKRLQHAATEVQLASDALETFRQATAPQRLARERLDLRGVKDRAQESADELAQIEIMYDEQDLDDRTAEFVVSRGRREAERAQERIAIAEAALSTLEQRELPQEEARLELELARKRAAHEALQREIEIARRNTVISVKEATHAVAAAERELADARKGAEE